MKRWLSKFSGLNNRVAGTRIDYDPNNGVSCLSEAVNIDIDESRRISRRRGMTATALTTPCHSLFYKNGVGLVVSNDTLYGVDRGFNLTTIRDELELNAKMYYCYVNGQVYYSNNFQNGFVEDNINYDWIARPYVGIDTYKAFSSPPLCTLIEYHSSRLYIVVGNKTIVYSEPFAFSWFNLASNYLMFSSEITMIASVGTGIYISDATGVYFYFGKSPKSFEIQKVSSSPAIAGTMVKTQGKFINRGVDGEVPVWTATDGIYVGEVNGTVTNLTKDFLMLPSGSGIEGCAVVDETRKKYITSIIS